MKNELLEAKLKMIIFPRHSNNCETAFKMGSGSFLSPPRDECFCGAFKRYDEIISKLLVLFEEEKTK